MLSGFLIIALLLSEQGQHGGVRFGSFYGRRALRLLPALFLVLGAYAVYNAIAGIAQDPLIHTTRYAAVYISNWQAIWDLNSVALGMGHLWSLSVEEQFYLIWPWILIFLLGIRRNATLVAGVLGTAIVVIAVRRAVMWQSISGDLSPLAGITANTRLFEGTDTRADELLIGALLASLWVRGKTPTKGVVPAAWIGAGVLLLCIEFTNGGKSFIYMGGFDLIAVAAAALILAAVDGRWIGNRVLSTRPLRLVGKVSYGLYLWHLPIFFVVAQEASNESRRVRITLAYSITIAFTAASWLLVEQPALRLKRHLEREQDVSVDRSGGAPPKRAWKPVRSAILGLILLVGAFGLVIGLLNLTSKNTTAAQEDYYWPEGRSLVVDDFDRPDAPRLGAAPTGQRWETLSGTWSTADHQAVLDGEGFAVVQVDANHIRAVGGGIAFRCRDANNCWWIQPLSIYGNWALNKIVDGKFENLANIGLAPTDPTSVFVVHQDGDEIKIVIDGIVRKQIKDPDLRDEVGVGLAASFDGFTTRWRRFEAAR